MQSKRFLFHSKIDDYLKFGISSKNTVFLLYVLIIFPKHYRLILRLEKQNSYLEKITAYDNIKSLSQISYSCQQS